MNTDFRLEVGFPRHHKLTKLIRLVGPSAVQALLCLWSHVTQYRPKGSLAGMDPTDIAVASGWDVGRADEWVAALLECRWLDRRNGHLEIHEWKQHQPYAYHSEQRSKVGRMYALKRWESRNKLHGSPIGTPNGYTDAPSPAPAPAPDPDPDPRSRSSASRVATEQATLSASGSSPVSAFPSVGSGGRSKEGKVKKKAKTAKNASEQAISGNGHDPTPHDEFWKEDCKWAFDLWLARYKRGTWSGKEWACFASGRKALADTQAFRHSWAAFLADDDPFYAGHYPSTWFGKTARWLVPKKGTLEALVKKNAGWVPPERRNRDAE